MLLLVPRQIALWKSKSSSSLEFSHCVESESSLLCGHYKLTSVMKTWIEMSGNGVTSSLQNHLLCCAQTFLLLN